MSDPINSLRDKLHRKNNARSYQRALDSANDIIERAVAAAGDGVIAVGLSGGKDSVAMLHLVAQHCSPLVIHNDSGLELPDSLPLVRSYCERLRLELAIAKGNAMALEASGASPKQVAELALYKPVRDLLKARSVALEFVGLRAAESKRRRLVIGARGDMYPSKTWGCTIAWPMRHWQTADIFAYIDEHDLPLHPAYATHANKPEERDSVRVSWAFDSERLGVGEVQWLRLRYPAYFRKLRDLGILDNEL